MLNFFSLIACFVQIGVLYEALIAVIFIYGRQISPNFGNFIFVTVHTQSKLWFKLPLYLKLMPKEAFSLFFLNSGVRLIAMQPLINIINRNILSLMWVYEDFNVYEDVSAYVPVRYLWYPVSFVND